ncbi:MAG: hypothetical protein Tp1111SUR768151_2 [Prokaryotic dsDNA virus sp.]|nr:MAG: hypothetical protein Tp1111SUR768151_2 [Prokaryotic dsDNA virus sp.]|tara:strand:- start:24792 stop:25013 length:222 start_codon:yes stop_codon:yes gene_type:complete
MAKKEKEQKPVLNLDGEEHEIDSMNDEQKVMINHIADLDRKINTTQFNLQQLQFGKSAFVNALKESLTEEEEK